MTKRTSYKSWPFKEAQRILNAHADTPPDQPVLFETGYGPSGLPHIGTFAEVARTTWVKHAFEELTGRPTRLIAFADDLDGLRKVPGNVPHPDMLRAHLGKPLSDIPDPFGCCSSFSDHMVGKLKEFLDTFGFSYELRRASEAYRSGAFNDGLAVLLDKVEEVLDLILPTMKEENRAHWSPFLPKCQACGKIYTTVVTAYHKDARELSYTCSGTFGDVSGCGHSGRTSIFDGHVKMGWKVDWALRWYAYGIHYEMYGKDLIPSAELSARIVRIMGKQPPVGMFYEMFLDERGEKISKSVGNGISMEEWLAYAPISSLAYFIFRDPRTAKKLHLDVIPKAMDEYLDLLRRYPDLSDEKKKDSPLWHIHDRGTQVPSWGSTINFTMVNNLVSALGLEAPDPEKIADFLTRYDASVTAYPQILRELVDKGVAYYLDRILPNKQYRPASDQERPLFAALKAALSDPGAADWDAKTLQNLVFDIAKEHGVEAPAFFAAIYQVLLGQPRGPRFGTFAKLVGVDRVVALIEAKVG